MTTLNRFQPVTKKTVKSRMDVKTTASKNYTDCGGSGGTIVSTI